MKTTNSSRVLKQTIMVVLRSLNITKKKNQDWWFFINSKKPHNTCWDLHYKIEKNTDVNITSRKWV